MSIMFYVFGVGDWKESENIKYPGKNFEVYLTSNWKPLKCLNVSRFGF